MEISALSATVNTKLTKGTKNTTELSTRTLFESRLRAFVSLVFFVIYAA
jgi:hypothetical protein